MPRPIKVCIDPAAMAHNLERVLEILRQSAANPADIPKVWAVIKANAYGHGIEVAVKAFAKADGLAMLDVDEAVRCRLAGWTKPILLLEGFFDGEDLQACRQWDLWPVVHAQGQIDMLNKADLQSFGVGGLRVFIKLDTGMHRLGFVPAAYRQAYEQLLALKAQGKLADVAHMTHFACADEPDGIDSPLLVFEDTVHGLAGPRCVANSASVLRHTRKILKLHESSAQGSWVRPGVCLYGICPMADMTAAELGLKPSMSLQSQVISVKTVPSGVGVGYSYRYRTSSDTRLAVVACGYADGYPRHAPNGTPVVVRGKRASLVGRVSMDMLAIDVTHIGDVQVGDPVVLWGKAGLSAEEIANASGTIAYTLMTGVTTRVRRCISE